MEEPKNEKVKKEREDDEDGGDGGSNENGVAENFVEVNGVAVDVRVPLPLACKWHFTAQPWQPASDAVLDLYTFETVQTMWRCLHTMPVTKHMEATLHYSMSLLREGIKAEWEHERNIRGGNLFWKQILSKEDIETVWQNFVMFAVGETAEHARIINGVRCIIKEGKPRFELWFGTATNDEVNGLAMELKTFIENCKELSVKPDFAIFGVRPHPKADKFVLEGHEPIKVPARVRRAPHYVHKDRNARDNGRYAPRHGGHEERTASFPPRSHATSVGASFGQNTDGNRGGHRREHKKRHPSSRRVFENSANTA